MRKNKVLSSEHSMQREFKYSQVAYQRQGQIKYLQMLKDWNLQRVLFFFSFFLIFTVMRLIFWINIVSQVFFFFEKNVVSYVDALPLLCYAGASCCQSVTILYCLMLCSWSFTLSPPPCSIRFVNLFSFDSFVSSFMT